MTETTNTTVTTNMTAKFLRRTWLLMPAVAAALIAFLLTQSSSHAASTATDTASRAPCTTSPNGTFSLTAMKGRMSLPDGNSVLMWSYVPTGEPFQYPGPVLCVHEGDNVTITLNNTLPEATSIIFPGQEGVLADGAPSGPVGGATITSLAPTAAATSGTVTYSFTAGKAGTYIYESGTDQGKQLDMGLAGALVVRPSGHDNWAFGDARTQFNTDAEVVMLLSMLDPALHLAVERNRKFDMATYRARYFLINGRSFPDTIAPDNAPWLPEQPYGSLLRLQPYTDAPGPWHDPGLVRYLNVSNTTIPFHPHGIHGRLVGRDGHELVGPANEDLSYEKFAFVVGPGQTFDATYKWTAVEPWYTDPNAAVNPASSLPGLQDLTFKDSATYYGGSPYLGQKAEFPVGTTSYNECGEYYQVMHSHALNHVTNYGVSGGGMLTMMRIDPPGGC